MADRGLVARMLATLGLTALLGVAVVAAVYAGLRVALFLLFVLSGVPAPSTHGVVAGIGTAGVVAATLAAEASVGRVVSLAETGAEPVPPEQRPALRARVEYLAATFGVPAPTVAVVDDAAPLALTTGVRRSASTLVLSTGTLDALDDDELDAVLAHELAHVANRDTAVMTAAALPTVVATRLRRWAGAGMADRTRDGTFFDVPVFLVAGTLDAAGRVLLAVLARYRELAADRAAARATGDPAALAAALRTLAGGDRPSSDLRVGATAAAFAIVDPHDDDPVTLGPEGRREPFLAGPRRWFRELTRMHPPVDRRLAGLREVAAAMEREGG